MLSTVKPALKQAPNSSPPMRTDCSGIYWRNTFIRVRSGSVQK